MHVRRRGKLGTKTINVTIARKMREKITIVREPQAEITKCANENASEQKIENASKKTKNVRPIKRV